MDGIYGLHQPSTAVVAEMDEYSDKGLMSAAAPHENLMFPPLPSSSVYHHQQQHRNLYGSLREGRFGRVFGSDELISMTASTMSETASTIDPPPQPTIISGVCGGGGIWRGKNNNDDDDNGDVLSVIKAKIASHPRYPCLLQAYIDCQKVGAPPEIACLLDEIQRGNNVVCRSDSGVSTSWLGADPELDDFMETYCNALNKYKSDLSRPFEEAKTFLNKIETQLTNLCNGAVVHTPSVSSDEEYSGGEIDVQDLQLKDEERDLKDRLHRRFGSHISSLKLEFSKKKKKGKLPRDARQLLLDWWDLHSKWPYPTEADKITLADSTGLDQRQINNWFINQRKRHWKSSVNMQFALMDDISG